jgi:hypothetical protein
MMMAWAGPRAAMGQGAFSKIPDSGPGRWSRAVEDVRRVRTNSAEASLKWQDPRGLPLCSQGGCRSCVSLFAFSCRTGSGLDYGMET